MAMESGPHCNTTAFQLEAKRDPLEAEPHGSARGVHTDTRSRYVVRVFNKTLEAVQLGCTARLQARSEGKPVCKLCYHNQLPVGGGQPALACVPQAKHGLITETDRSAK
jgi:hypothetical protein